MTSTALRSSRMLQLSTARPSVATPDTAVRGRVVRMAATARKASRANQARTEAQVIMAVQMEPAVMVAQVEQAAQVE